MATFHSSGSGCHRKRRTRTSTLRVNEVGEVLEYLTHELQIERWTSFGSDEVEDLGGVYVTRSSLHRRWSRTSGARLDGAGREGAHTPRKLTTAGVRAVGRWGSSFGRHPEPETVRASAVDSLQILPGGMPNPPDAHFEQVRSVALWEAVRTASAIEEECASVARVVNDPRCSPRLVLSPCEPFSTFWRERFHVGAFATPRRPTMRHRAANQPIRALTVGLRKVGTSAA